MYKSTLVRKEIVRGQYDMFNRFLSSLPIDKKYLCFYAEKEGDSYYYYYEEFDSTGLSIPVRFGYLFYIDADSGRVYFSRSASPFYVPLFDLERLVVDLGLDWELFLKACIKYFTAVQGVDFAHLDEIVKESISSSSSYDDSRSLSFNFLKLGNFEGSDVDTKRRTINQFFNAFVGRDTFRTLNMIGVLGKREEGSSAFVNGMNFDYELLENSFQEPIFKDFISALAGDTSMEEVVKKVKDSGITKTLSLKPSHINPDVLKRVLSDRAKEILLMGGDEAVGFPYEVVANQMSKLVRRFKLKGII